MPQIKSKGTTRMAGTNGIRKFYEIIALYLFNVSSAFDKTKLGYFFSSLTHTNTHFPSRYMYSFSYSIIHFNAIQACRNTIEKLQFSKT